MGFEDQVVYVEFHTTTQNKRCAGFVLRPCTNFDAPASAVVPPCLVVHPGEHSQHRGTFLEFEFVPQQARWFPRAWSCTRGNIFMYMYSHLFPRAWSRPRGNNSRNVPPCLFHASGGTFYRCKQICSPVKFVPPNGRVSAFVPPC